MIRRNFHVVFPTVIKSFLKVIKSFLKVIKSFPEATSSIIWSHTRPEALIELKYKIALNNFAGLEIRQLCC